MKKVFLVFTHTAFEFVHSFTTKVCENREDAVSAFNSTVEEFRAEAEDNDLDIDESETSFDAYRDGYANIYELSVTLTEETVL